jgi:3-methyladenine DNA glycosylase AlkD
MHTAAAVRKDLQALGTLERAESSAWFFKTGPGQYGEGDKFYGVKVPETRQIVKRHAPLALGEVEKLLLSDWHEERLAACLLLVSMYKKGDTAERQEVYEFYLNHNHHVNNWDLVDTSAEYIVGPHVADTDFKVLKKLARSLLIWDRRIAMLACFHFIKKGEAEPALTIAEILLDDEHDLIRKAVGWMLREVGKRVDERIEQDWLLESDRYKTMPRTTLRYAIEHFSPELRKRYLAGTA